MDSFNGYESVLGSGLAYDPNPQLANSPFNWQPIPTNEPSSHLGLGSTSRQVIQPVKMASDLTSVRYGGYACPSFAAQSMSSQMTSDSSLNSKTYLESNEEKFNFKKLTECLDNLKQNNGSFQSDILRELRQLRQAVDNMKNSLNELPIRFAEVFAHCLDSVNSRSENASITSLPEVVDILDKMDLKGDAIEDGFVTIDERHNTDNTEIFHNLEPKTTNVDKFVFEYNSYIDLDIWLKKE